MEKDFKLETILSYTSCIGIYNVREFLDLMTYICDIRPRDLEDITNHLKEVREYLYTVYPFLKLIKYDDKKWLNRDDFIIFWKLKYGSSLIIPKPREDVKRR